MTPSQPKDDGFQASRCPPIGCLMNSPRNEEGNRATVTSPIHTTLGDATHVSLWQITLYNGSRRSSLMTGGERWWDLLWEDKEDHWHVGATPEPSWMLYLEVWVFEARKTWMRDCRRSHSLSVQNHSHSWRPKDRYQEQEYGYRALKRLHSRRTHSQSHGGSRRWPSDALANVSRTTSTNGDGPDVTRRNSKSRRVSWWTRSRFLQVRVRLVHCSIVVGGTIDTLTHHLLHGAPTSQSGRRWIVWSGKCSGYFVMTGHSPGSSMVLGGVTMYNLWVAEGSFHYEM